MGDDTDAIIREALEEEQKEKRKRKREKKQTAIHTGEESDEDDDDDGEQDRGKNVRGIEEEDEGPIRESMVTVAQTSRAATRKGKGIGDAGLVGNIEEAEEREQRNREQLEKEHGIELEAFNLVEERKRGYFDKDGNYIERQMEEKDEEEEEDAWLDSDQAKVVDEATLRKIEERQKREEAKRQQQEDSVPLKAQDIAKIQHHVSKILYEDETVAAALKRLAGPRQRPGMKMGRSSENAQRPDGNKEEFEKLTEYSTMLMDAGETDVYSRDQSYFRRAAALYIDEPTDKAGPSTRLTTKSRMAYEDADEDMFGDFEDEKEKDEDAKGQRDNGDAETETKRDVEAQFQDWPIKELKRYCHEHGKSTEGVTEKEELMHLAATCVQTATTFQAPLGYTYDASSGLWWSSEAQMYYDSNSGVFYNPASKQWVRWDGKDWHPCT